MEHIFPMKRQSILILGAAGRTGLECIRSLSKHCSRPDIHAFCKDTSNFPEQSWSLCKSVIEGSARHAVDIEEALKTTKADWIIICVGTGNNNHPSDVRKFTGQNVARILMKSVFQDIQVIAISMAPPSQFSRFRLRHVLSDHKGQENSLKVLGQRALIVRCNCFTSPSLEEILDSYTLTSTGTLSHSLRSTSSLSSNSSTDVSKSNLTGSPLSRKKQFSWLKRNNSLEKIAPTPNDSDYSRSYLTNRTDLAEWIAQKVCYDCLNNIGQEGIGSTTIQFPQAYRGGSACVVNIGSIKHGLCRY